jgi:hypothetical protein
MSIEKTDKLVEALRGMTREAVETLPPVERRRLREALQQALRTTQAVTGILAELGDGRGRQ